MTAFVEDGNFSCGIARMMRHGASLFVRVTFLKFRRPGQEPRRRWS